MKTLKENQKWSAGLNTYMHSMEASPRPKVGDDDGISDRAMNILIIVFMLLTVSVSIAAAKPNDEVKYRIILRQAMLDIDRMDYDKAVVKLLEVRANTDETALVNHLLGKSYLYGDISAQKAVLYLSLAQKDLSADYEDWDLDETQAPLENSLMLARAFEKTGQFEAAAEYYDHFLSTLRKAGWINPAEPMP